MCENGNESCVLPSTTINNFMTHHNAEQAVDGGKNVPTSAQHGVISDAAHLADLFGTPLLVVHESELRATMRRFRDAFSRPAWQCSIVYAGKALMLQAIAQIAREEGLLLDVCSEGELQTILRAGISAEWCVFHGCAKSAHELKLALSSGTRFVVVDNAAEIVALSHIVVARAQQCTVLVRINPGVAAATQPQIQTSGAGSKFGFPVNDGQAEAAVIALQQTAGLLFAGLHCHIGSQIFELDSYEAEIAGLADFAALLRRKHAIDCAVVNLGGGLGLSESSARPAPSAQAWADTVFNSIDKHFGQANLPRPSLMVEPGRAIIAGAGTTLYRVVVEKTLGTGERALIVDGGMSDNPRPALYQAAYEVALASGERNAPADRRYTVFGRHCETDL